MPLLVVTVVGDRFKIPVKDGQHLAVHAGMNGDWVRQTCGAGLQADFEATSCTCAGNVILNWVVEERSYSYRTPGCDAEGYRASAEMYL